MKAISDFEAAIRFEPTGADNYNALAWLWATCSDGKLRNAKKAIDYARKACELTAWKSGAILDTLAAAYAESGQFDEAVNWEKKALAMPDLANQVGDSARARLKLYQQRKPYREN